MSGILSDPKIIEATNGLIAILLAGVGGIIAMWFARLKTSMESHMQRVTKAAEEAKKAAQSADAQVSNDHSTNFRDDLDEVRDAVKAKQSGRSQSCPNSSRASRRRSIASPRRSRLTERASRT